MMHRKATDLTGYIFGRLKVIERYEPGDKKYVKWVVKCECGGSPEFTARADALKRGKTKSCGCINSEVRAHIGRNNLKDLSGKVYGFLTVISRSPKKEKHGQIFWYVVCDHGGLGNPSQPFEVIGCNIKRGLTKSCGCINKERLSEIRKSHPKMIEAIEKVRSGEMTKERICNAALRRLPA